jgi:hypothetical protein
MPDAIPPADRDGSAAGHARTPGPPGPPSPPSAQGSCFADAAAARAALQLALPLIEPLLARPAVCGSGCAHVVVMDPALGPQDAGFDQAVLLDAPLGDASRRDADYAGFARAKARLAWRSGRDGRALQALSPQALRPGDSLLAGAVVHAGIVVAVSGAQPAWDEAIATTIAACLLAQARQRWADAQAAGQLAAD